MLGIIINTKAGKKAYLLQRYYLFDLLRERGEEYIYRITQYPNHARELARELAEEQGIRRFLILGGDGTISEAINGLMEARIPDRDQLEFGFMPRGTGNDYGRYWHLTKDYQDALDRFFHGRPRPVDVGCVTYFRNGNEHHHYFINSVGFGIDAKTCLWAQNLKYYIGSHSWSYTIALLCAVWTHKSAPLHIKTNEGLELNEKLFTMNIGVGPYSGGGIRQNPDADPTDGIFHSMFVQPPTFMEILKAIPKVLAGGRLTDLDIVHSFTASELEVTVDTVDPKSGQKLNNLIYEADGILVQACTPYKITCMHHALKIIC